MRFLSIIFFTLFLSLSYGQTSSNNRVSPLDTVELHNEDLNIKITYSRPFLKGREFGKDIVPFGRLWRTGANEATIFETNRDILVEGQELKAGKYSLYSIPDAEETTIIFNKVWNQWGTQYDKSQDVLRVNVPTIFTDYSSEQFTIDLDEAGAACLTWGNSIFTFHFEQLNDE